MRRTTSVSTPVAHLIGPGKLKVVNGHLAFTAREQGPLRLDPQALRTILCYGAVGVTDEAFRVLFRHDVHVAWLTPAGNRCRGRLVRSDPQTTTVRLLQHQAFRDPAYQRDWAGRIVLAKVHSQLQAARHYQRHGCRVAGPVLQQLQAALVGCHAAGTLDQLRGVEGSASAAWFGLYGQLLNPPWQFTQRVRRPPTDPVNALLSLGYTWLLTRTVARCEAAGLEIYLGTLHEYRPGRPSLACDLIEPLRIPAVDRWAVTLCNQNRVSADDFHPENGGIRLQPTAFGSILQDWEEHWINEGPAQALDEWVLQLVGQLRQWAALSSAPPVTPEEQAL
jgi:CRISPR-associated protein Cas1